MACLVALCAIASSSCSARTARKPVGAWEFVQSAITHESADKARPAAADYTHFLTPRFRMAVERDRTGGEEGWLDHDPLCLCQDPAGLEFAIISITGDSNRAMATIRAGTATAQWQLIRFAGQWRIADIAEYVGGGESEVPSVLLALERWPQPTEADPDAMFFGCSGMEEHCLFLSLGNQAEPDQKLVQLICGTAGSVDRHTMRGAEGLVAVNCGAEKTAATESVWLIEFVPGEYSVWKREQADGQLTWDNLPAGTAFDDQSGILAAEQDCIAGKKGWRGKWVWLGERFERMEFSEQDCGS
jgi:hypothetical protein